MMRAAILAIACITLTACSAPEETGDSDESKIRQSAAALEKSANTDVERQIREIEAETEKTTRVPLRSD
jgi:maltose-binding protein MalE